MDLIEYLRRAPLFEQLSEENLRRVSHICEERTIPPGRRLCWQADLGSTFFIVDSGEATIHRIDERGFQRPKTMLRAGESFGTTSLFLAEPRDATVTAVTEMHVWTIQRADFQALLDDEPSLWHELRIPGDILAKLRAPRYPWLEPGEHVVRHSRRHWIVFVRSVFWVTASTFVYVVFTTWVVFSLRLSLNILLLVLPVLGLASLGFVWHWYSWRNDYFVVTNRRVTHHEQVAFLYESRDETPIQRVQDISIQRAPLGRLLGCGDLTIQTAAKVGSIVFSDAPAPEEMRDAIFGELNRFLATQRATQRRQIRGELASHIAAEAGETPFDAVSTLETPVDRAEEPDLPEAEPGKLVQAVMWLADMGLVPRTRIMNEKENTVTWRKHWVFLVADVLPSFLLSLVLSVLTVIGLLGHPAGLVAFLPSYPYGTLFFALVAMGWFWWQSTDWANDLYTVTSDRIIDVEKKPLFFAEQRREASLGAIQNVSLKIPNMLAVVFNYGDVLVQTAAQGEFTFDKAPNPREVQREIFRRMEAFQEAQRATEASRRRAELAEWFAVYDELRRSGQQPAIPSPLTTTRGPRAAEGNPPEEGDAMHDSRG